MLEERVCFETGQLQDDPKFFKFAEWGNPPKQMHLKGNT